MVAKFAYIKTQCDYNITLFKNKGVYLKFLLVKILQRREYL